MGRPISYEMQMMFVGSSGAFEEAMNTGSGISRLDFIQGYDFSFNIERTPLKQIGSDSFATRQTQLAPDVNLNIQYYLNDGWNDKYIGLDIPTGATGNPFDSILSSTGDRNFYISIAQNDGMDQNLQTGIVNSNILAIGNAYITNYEISVAVNQLATVSCSFVGANANVQDYATSKYLPSVNTLVSGQNAQDANKNFSLNFVNNSRTERYLPKATEVFDGGCPYSKCKITPDFQSGGGTSPITFGFFDAIANNFQSMQFSVQFERKALYGFGNNHPYIRKIQRPTVATLTLSSLIDDFQAENLSKVFHAEGGTKSSMLIEFFNLQDVKKFGLSLQNLTLESYNLGARIGDRVLVETNWTVEVKNGAGADIGMIGSYGAPLLDATKVNESFNVQELYYEIFAGDDTTIALKTNNILMGWGENTSYEIANVKNYTFTPTSIFPKTFRKISFGSKYGLAIDETGMVWGWGANSVKQTGGSQSPFQINLASLGGQRKTFCQISAGVNANNFSHSIAIDKNGAAWGWGWNSSGQIGDGTSGGSKITPVAVYGNKIFCKISAGPQSTLAIDSNGKAWGWGYNLKGLLGNGTSLSALTPVAVYGNKTFCEISAFLHTSAIDKNGKAWGWGYSRYGQIGDGSITVGSGYLTPKAVYGSKTFCKISAGQFHTLAIDKYGKGWAWGFNSYGQLGNFSYQQHLTPIAICGNKTFCQISAGKQYSVALDKNNQAWAWGANYMGQLGNNSPHNTPKSLNLINSQKTFSSIQAAENCTLAIDKNGKAWGWGYNLYYQLGIGANSNPNAIYTSPVAVYGNKTFCKIFIMQRSCIALDKYNKAWGWGYNGFGQLGSGSVSTYQCTPVAVYGNKTFCEISISNSHCLAIDKDGKAWAWGSRSVGRLGDNSFVGSSNTPVAVYGNKTFCKISAGAYSSLAIDKNGKLWTWGGNRFLTLGAGLVTTSVATPVAVCASNQTFCKISVGGSSLYGSSLAIDKYGQIFGWGDTYLTRPSALNITRSPTVIKGTVGKTFCTIQVGLYQSFAQEQNGTSWGWGSNRVGQLGDGSVVFRTSPVSVSGAKKTFCQITTNYMDTDSAFTLGLDKNGKIWAWASAVPYGFLGEFNLTTPIKVFNI